MTGYAEDIESSTRGSLQNAGNPDVDNTKGKDKSNEEEPTEVATDPNDDARQEEKRDEYRPTQVAAAVANSRNELSYIMEVRKDDILMGRGAPYSSWEGNVRFRAIVAQYQEAYVSATPRPEKDKIAREILRQLAQKTARFLRKIDSAHELAEHNVPEGETVYLEEREPVAVEKIKQALRHGEQSKSSGRRNGTRESSANDDQPHSASTPGAAAATATVTAVVEASVQMSSGASRNATYLLEQGRSSILPQASGLHALNSVSQRAPPQPPQLWVPPQGAIGSHLSPVGAFLLSAQMEQERRQLRAAIDNQALQTHLQREQIRQRQIIDAATASLAFGASPNWYSLLNSSVSMLPNPINQASTGLPTILPNQAALAMSGPAGAHIGQSSLLTNPAALAMAGHVVTALAAAAVVATTPPNNGTTVNPNATSLNPEDATEPRSLTLLPTCGYDQENSMAETASLSDTIDSSVDTSSDREVGAAAVGAAVDSLPSLSRRRLAYLQNAVNRECLSRDGISNLESPSLIPAPMRGDRPPDGNSATLGTNSRARRRRQRTDATRTSTSALAASDRSQKSTSKRPKSSED